MSVRHLVPVVSLSLALLIGAGALMSHGHEQNERKSGTTAMVDMESLFQAAGGPEQMLQREMELRQEAQQRVGNAVSVPYLNQQELVEYMELNDKAQPTPDQTTRMKTLKSTSDRRADELQVLQAKGNAQLSDADKGRMRELLELRKNLQAVLPTLEEAANSNIQERKQLYRHQIAVQLRQVVGQVAKEKGIEQVFDTSAMVYNATDLTQLVLQKLNKRPGKQ